MHLEVRQTEGGPSKPPFFIALTAPVTPRRDRAFCICNKHHTSSILPMPGSRLHVIIEQTVADGPCYILDIHIRGSDRSPILDVVLDSDTGPTADVLAAVSREIRFAVDIEISTPYTLNVSSPGADRPLVLPRQFRKHIGRTLRVSLGNEEDPQLEVGRLEAANEEGIELGGVGYVPYSSICSAKVNLPW